MAKARVLVGDTLPHIPAATGLQVWVPCGGRVLGTHGGVLHATAVGDEHQIVLGQVDGGFITLVVHVDAHGKLLGGRAGRVALEEAGGGLNLLDGVLAYAGVLALGAGSPANREFHVLDLGVVAEFDAVRFQILDHRQNHRLVLVVAGETQRGKVRQASDVMNVALDVQLHFQRGVPVFEGEHGAPVQPEVGVQHLIIEEIGDRLVIQVFVRGEEQLHDFHRSLVGQPELALEPRVLAEILGGAAQRVVRVLLVEPVVLVEYADAFGFDGGNRAEQIPHDLEMIVHFAAATHHIAKAGNIKTVTGAAGYRVLLKDVDVLARHLTITHQTTGCRQCRQSGTDDVCMLVVHVGRLLRTCESLIIAAAVVHIPPPWGRVDTSSTLLE